MYIDIIGAVIPSRFKWLSTVVLGSESLILLFGYDKFKNIMSPMTKPFLLKLLLLFLLSFFIKGLLVLIGELLHTIDINSVVMNPAISASSRGTVFSNLLDVIKTSVSIIGEEFLVAGIVLPMFFNLKKYRFGWELSSLIVLLPAAL